MGWEFPRCGEFLKYSKPIKSLREFVLQDTCFCGCVEVVETTSLECKKQVFNFVAKLPNIIVKEKGTFKYLNYKHLSHVIYSASTGTLKIYNMSLTLCYLSSKRHRTYTQKANKTQNNVSHLPSFQSLSSGLWFFVPVELWAFYCSRLFNKRSDSNSSKAKMIHNISRIFVCMCTLHRVWFYWRTN